jgi:hypothetical protein
VFEHGSNKQQYIARCVEIGDAHCKQELVVSTSHDKAKENAMEVLYFAISMTMIQLFEKFPCFIGVETFGLPKDISIMKQNQTQFVILKPFMLDQKVYPKT